MQVLPGLLALIGCLAGVQSKEWLSNANYYQIYPRSFKDSNEDGVGDLKGINEKVPYLKQLGMDGVWLSPIMKSPMVDYGYDIADYRDIHYEYGTLADMDTLIATFKANGLRLILDFVPNHTSDLHDWFVKSEAGHPDYKDYYLWHPGKPNPFGGRPLPPNNWLSIFRGSAWQWSGKRQEYYYHIFLKEQPDLNYRNPKVVEEMKEVLRFWLRKGIGGFRVDAVPYLFEVEADEDGNYPDETINGNCDPDIYCYLNNEYTQSLPETWDMMYQWRAVLLEEEFKNDPRVLMLEAYTSFDTLFTLYGDETRPGAQIPFNFELLGNVKRETTGKRIRQITENYMNYIPSGYEANWLLGNHDSHRLTGRVGDEKAEVCNFLLQTLPGNAVTYQGEEILTPNYLLSWADTVDPPACITNETVYQENSRDPGRTPFLWDDSEPSAGFSTNAKPWLPVGPYYKKVNVKLQEAAASSPLKNFRKLTTLRKTNAFQIGLYESAKNVDDDVYLFLRSYDKLTYIVALNFGTRQQVINLSANFREVPSRAKVVIASMTSTAKENAILTTSQFTLAPNSAIVAQFIADAVSSSDVSSVAPPAALVSTEPGALDTPKGNSSAMTFTASLIAIIISIILALKST